MDDNRTPCRALKIKMSNNRYLERQRTRYRDQLKEEDKEE
jgi:hypothetical protein